MNPQLKKGVLELCVLSQLTSKDKYGYELTDAMSQEMSIAAGTLYMILKRLKEAGYVETYLLESPLARRGNIITLLILVNFISRRKSRNGSTLSDRSTGYYLTAKIL